MWSLSHLPAVWESQVQSLGQEYSLEKGMATHSSILAWWIPWTEEPVWLQSMESQRVRHDWATYISQQQRPMINVIVVEAWSQPAYLDPLHAGNVVVAWSLALGGQLREMRPELSPQAPPTVLVTPSLLWSLEKLKVNRATWAVIGPIELCESWHYLIGPIELCESWHSSWALMEEGEARTHLQSWVSTGKSRWLGLQGRWWQAASYVLSSGPASLTRKLLSLPSPAEGGLP